MERDEREVARRSAAIYLPLSIAAGLAFWFLAGLAGPHPILVRVGGTVWVTLLSLIVLMPVVTSWTKKRRKH